jgi:hypothetical protein
LFTLIAEADAVPVWLVLPVLFVDWLVGVVVLVVGATALMKAGPQMVMSRPPAAEMAVALVAETGRVSAAELALAPADGT